MNAFKTVNDAIANLNNQMHEQTEHLTHVMREIQFTNYLNVVNTANSNYEMFVSSPNKQFYGNFLKEYSLQLVTAINGLHGAIGPFFDAYLDKFLDFGEAFDLMSDITAKVAKAKMAAAVGCARRCAEMDIGESVCANTCQNRIM